MKPQRSNAPSFVGATPYECTASRRDYANDYKPKPIRLWCEVTFQMPPECSGDFYSSAREKGARTDPVVNHAFVEIYVQGVYTRRVIDVLHRLLGPEIALSRAQVSRTAAKLNEGLKAWRERPLGEDTYLFLDACYENDVSANAHVS